MEQIVNHLRLQPLYSIRYTPEKMFHRVSSHFKPHCSRVLHEAIQIHVLGHFATDPCKLIKKVADTTYVSVGFAHNVIRYNQFQPYIIKISHALNEDDSGRRLKFVKIWPSLLTNLLRNMGFTDNVHSMLMKLLIHTTVGIVVTRTLIYLETIQRIQSIVWARILGDARVDLRFLNKNLTEEVCI